ncbi:hypothetical protein [Paenibacillus cisolokensis]|uniref:hypothetical protein n=1 Tax=Paenibacillus cisolokensis TaxID=1658519 RepID=UPI001BD0336E|nr:hypothetical protein [Paenibacillus cisolokensis]
MVDQRTGNNFTKDGEGRAIGRMTITDGGVGKRTGDDLTEGGAGHVNGRWSINERATI